MIIVEGTDLVGKTTLCKKLATELAGDGYVYQHLSRLPDAFDRIGGYLDLASRRTVRDRFHMSEVAYTYARGEEHRLLTPEKYRIVDGALRMMGAVTVVIVCSSEDQMRDRFADREEHEMYRFEIVMWANIAFNSLCYSSPRALSSLDAFQVDVDYVIDCNRGHPFPDDDDVRRILELYQIRQDHVPL